MQSRTVDRRRGKENLMATTSQQDRDFGAEFFAQILNYISDNISPDDVFSQSELEEWARSNGFHTNDECPEREE